MIALLITLLMAGKSIVLFDAEKAQIREMNSYAAAIALRVGEFPLFDNWRWDDRTMKVRDGIVKLTSAAIVSPFAAAGGLTAIKGAKTLNVNGVQTTFVAIRNSADSETSVWKTTDGASFTEVTAGSGQYGNTRFSTTGDVSFCVIRHPIVYSSPDKVVFQNGVDTPRVYDGTNTVKLASITADTTMRENPVQMSPYRYFTINDQGNTTYSATGAGIAMADTGTVPDNTIRLTIQNTVTNGSTAQVVMSSGTGTPNSACAQLCMVVDSAYPVLFDRVKVEFGTSGGYVTVWDPYTANSPQPVFIPLDATGNRFVVAFDLQAAGIAPTTSYDRVRITWQGDSSEPTATVTADILAIWIGGTIEEPGQCRLGYTLMNSGSRGESPGTIFLNYEPMKIRDMGGPAQNHQRIPNSEALYFKYTIPYRNTDSTARDAGVDLLAIYKQKPGQSWPLYVGAVALATYSAGSWSFASGSASSALSSDVGLGIGDFRMPSALHLSMPIGTGMIAANQRVFVAAVGSSTNRAGVYVSSAENNYRFLRTVDANEGEESPFSLSYPGEVVKGFASTSTSTQGNAAVYTFNDKDLYVQSGYLTSELARVSRIGPHGTLSPHTILEHRDAVYWVDKDYQVLRMYQGMVQNLSRERVDDILKAVPSSRRNAICAGVFNDRVRFGHSIAAGTTNTNALGFNTIRGVWEFDDSLPCSAERMTLLGGTSPKFLAFGSDAHCYQIEQPSLTTDLGVNIATRWITPYIHGIFNGSLLVNSVSILGDYFSSGAWTWSFEYQPNSLSQTKTVSMDGASGIKFGINDVFTDSGTGGGFAVQGTMTGNAPGGTSIYSVSWEMEEIELVSTV